MQAPQPRCSGSVFLGLALVAQNRAVAIQDRLADGQRLSAAEINQFKGLEQERTDYMITAVPLLASAGLTLTIGGLLYFLDTPTVE